MYDAILLAGGSGRRLGGVDKAALVLGGGPLLGRPLQAVAGAERVIVVGPPRELPAGVLCVQESPPGSGPVSALAAGLAEVGQDAVVLLACDLPLISPATVARLIEGLAACPESDGTIMVDETGRHQPLLAAYRTGPLRRSLDRVARSRPGNTLAQAPMFRVLEELELHEVPSQAGESWDCDTWDDVERARRRLGERGEGSSQEETCR